MNLCQGTEKYTEEFMEFNGINFDTYLKNYPNEAGYYGKYNAYKVDYAKRVEGNLFVLGRKRNSRRRGLRCD